MAWIVPHDLSIKPAILISRQIFKIHMYECVSRPYLTPELFAEMSEAVLFLDTIQTPQTLPYTFSIVLILDGVAAQFSDAVEDQCLY
jgi:hypothetical protein